MKNLFHTIELNEYVGTQHFTKGNGFYIVKYLGWSGMQDDLHYFNNGFWVALETLQSVPTAFLDLWDKDEETKEEKPLEKGKLNVSEEFFLKAIAISKCNSQSIKISDIIK